MPTPDAVLPQPTPAARRAMEAARSLAGSDPAEARRLALPLLGQPALHVEALAMLIELSRYLTDDNDLSYTFSDGIIAINAPRAVDILKRHPAV